MQRREVFVVTFAAPKLCPAVGLNAALLQNAFGLAFRGRHGGAAKDFAAVSGA